MDLYIIGGLAFALVWGGLLVARRRGSRRHVAWREVADKRGLQRASPELMEGVVEGCELRVSEVGADGEAVVVHTRVEAAAAIPDMPPFVVYGRGAVGPLPLLPVVETGDSAFDRRRVLATDAPRAIRALLSPERRRVIEGLHPHLTLRASRGRILLEWWGAEQSAERLDAGIGLALDLAQTGREVVDMISALDGVEERRPDEFLRLWADFGAISSGFHGQSAQPTRPRVFELGLERAAVTLLPTYFRGEPGIRIEAPTEAELPGVSVRWDVDGSRHGEVPDGISVSELDGQGEGLLKLDGDQVRLVIRAPTDVAVLRQRAELVAALATTVVGPVYR